MPKDGRRFTRQEADKVIQEVIPALNAVGLKYEVCGSYRRGKADVGDIDILVTGKSLGKKLDSELSKLNVEMDWSGSDKVGFQLNGMHVDIKWVPKESWGAGLLHHTGPWGFNIKLRSVAKKKSWLLNEYGLYTREDRRPIAQKTEKEILLSLMNEESAIRLLNPSERKTPEWLEKRGNKSRKK
jgi:DNA polymerase/3'-5' exonuclease PolX